MASGHEWLANGRGRPLQPRLGARGHKTGLRRLAMGAAERAQPLPSCYGARAYFTLMVAVKTSSPSDTTLARRSVQTGWMTLPRAAMPS